MNISAVRSVAKFSAASTPNDTDVSRPARPFPDAHPESNDQPVNKDGKIKSAVKKAWDVVANKVDKAVEKWAIKATRDQTTQ